MEILPASAPTVNKEKDTELKEKELTKSNDLESKTVEELKNIAKEKNTSGYSTKNKKELIEAINTTN